MRSQLPGPVHKLVKEKYDDQYGQKQLKKQVAKSIDHDAWKILERLNVIKKEDGEYYLRGSDMLRLGDVYLTAVREANEKVWHQHPVQVPCASICNAQLVYP